VLLGFQNAIPQSKSSLPTAQSTYLPRQTLPDRQLWRLSSLRWCKNDTILYGDQNNEYQWQLISLCGLSNLLTPNVGCRVLLENQWELVLWSSNSNTECCRIDSNDCRSRRGAHRALITSSIEPRVIILYSDGLCEFCLPFAHRSNGWPKSDITESRFGMVHIQRTIAARYQHEMMTNVKRNHRFTSWLGKPLTGRSLQGAAFADTVRENCHFKIK